MSFIVWQASCISNWILRILLARIPFYWYSCCLDLKALATWEVDVTGLETGIPFSMYLLSGSILHPMSSTASGIFRLSF